VAVLAEPITNPGGGIGWAETALAASTRQAAANIFAEENKMDRKAGAEGTCMTTSKNNSKDEGQILISKRKRVKPPSAVRRREMKISGN
jgi:hypothetical protein